MISQNEVTMRSAAHKCHPQEKSTVSSVFCSVCDSVEFQEFEPMDEGEVMLPFNSITSSFFLSLSFFFGASIHDVYNRGGRGISERQVKDEVA